MQKLNYPVHPRLRAVLEAQLRDLHRQQTEIQTAALKKRIERDGAMLQRQFRDEGFVVVNGVFTPSEMDAVIAEAMEISSSELDV